MSALDDLANAADSLVRFKADEYAWAIKYANDSPVFASPATSPPSSA